MSYEQAMKHSKNHRKDRYYQQCSGYGGDGESHQKTMGELRNLEVSSFRKLLDAVKEKPFPIYISERGGFYCSVDEKNLFGHRIDSYAELVQFGKDFVGYEAPEVSAALKPQTGEEDLPQKPPLSERIAEASKKSALSDSGIRVQARDEKKI